MVCCIQNSDFSTRIASLHRSQPSSVVFACKRATFGSELQVSIGHRLRLLISTRITSLHGSQTSPVVLCFQNSVIRSWMTFVYWSHPSSVVLCIHNRDFSIRITGLHGSLTSPVVLCIQNNVRNTSLYGSQPSSVVFACKTATLAPELQVSMGPSPHLWILRAKQGLLDHNYKSLWVPDFAYRFVNAKQRA